MADDWLNSIIGNYSAETIESYGEGKSLLGVSGRLKETFPDCRIYAEEDVSQDFEEPGFFIKDLEYFDEKIIGHRYELGYSLDVHFFPSRGREYRKLREMIPIISDALEYIKVIDPVHLNEFRMTGTGRRAEIVDGVLHFFVTYNTHFRKPAPDIPEMLTQEQNQSIKRRD